MTKVWSFDVCQYIVTFKRWLSGKQSCPLLCQWKLNTGIPKKAHSEKHWKRCEKKIRGNIKMPGELGARLPRSQSRPLLLFHLFTAKSHVTQHLASISSIRVWSNTQTPFTLFKGQLVGERYRNHGTDRSGCKDSVWSFIATASWEGLKAPCSLMVELTAPSFYARGHPKYQPETWLVCFEFLL